jgi:hypothetical protein
MESMEGENPTAQHAALHFSLLFAVLWKPTIFQVVPGSSKLHADGSSFDGWYILGIDEIPAQQITYHLPLSRWAETDFACTLDKAPAWDNLSSADVLVRLKRLI